MTTKKSATEATEVPGDFSDPAFAEANEHLYDKAYDQTIPAEEAEEQALARGKEAEEAAKDEAKASASSNKAENQELHHNAAQHKAAHPDQAKK
jgi:hypothetical protein